MYIEDRIITLNLWDTAGQEKFKSLIPSYIKDSQAIVICYDITNPDSFESLDKWIEDARALRDVDQALVVIAGNKADLEDRREVSQEQAELFAKEKGLPLFEVSAMNGDNIKGMFNEIAKKLTGIETDLIKQSTLTREQLDAVKPASSYAQHAEKEQEGRFKLGAKTDTQSKQKKKNKCGC